MSLRWRTLEAPAPVVDSLVSGALHGVTLRAALPEDAREALIGGLPGQSRHALLHGEPEVFSYGLMLAPSEPEPQGAAPARYLDHAARDRALLAPLEATLLRLLSALAGRPAELASLSGRSCAFATVRVLPPGRRIPLHRDTYKESPIWEALAPACDPTTRLSWYVTLRPSGGQLSVCPTGADLDYATTAAGYPVPLAPGELVLFDAGRLFHQVGPVEGEAPRLTLGGFVAPSADGRRLLCWG